MKHISLPSLEAMKQKLEKKGPKHKTESASVCEEIGKEFGMNVYWMQYKYHPRVMRDALSSFQKAEKLPFFATPQKKFAYFLGILKKTL